MIEKKILFYIYFLVFKFILGINTLLQKVKGFRDIFGEDTAYWHKVEAKLQKFFKSCGFSEFRLPVLEKNSCFQTGHWRNNRYC